MKSMDKAIKTAKKLINLPYNQFNLDNYFNELIKLYGTNLKLNLTPKNQPIRLMAGDYGAEGIIELGDINKKTIYIIGKGILFDSGGLHLKTRGMTDMTGDKAGMIIALSVANFLEGNVTAYCPVTTNFIQTSKIIPGDEIKIGKKIVKITDTDAEGRLILAEALSTLNVNKNDIVITIATLTGAVEYAIGRATGVFGINNNLIRAYAIASQEENENAWGLPLWEDYEKKFYKGKMIKNYNKEIKCGATEAALFVKQFVKYPDRWIHLDCASSSFDENNRANGVPIKSLINFIKKIK